MAELTKGQFKKMEAATEKYIKEKGYISDEVEYSSDIEDDDNYFWICQFNGKKFRTIMNKKTKKIRVVGGY